MSRSIEVTNPLPTSGKKASFQDVVAYLHGVTDAMQAMQKNARSAWPAANEVSGSMRPGAGDVSGSNGEPQKSARLTLRHGEAEIELEGVLVLAQTTAPFHALPVRGGARFVELDGGGDTAATRGDPPVRGTLPYWAPAVSLVPARPFAGGTEMPPDIDEPTAALPYSALALSLVPVAFSVPCGGWGEEDGGERVSGIRLRAAPLSAELYALTGTDDWEVD